MYSKGNWVPKGHSKDNRRAMLHAGTQRILRQLSTWGTRALERHLGTRETGYLGTWTPRHLGTWALRHEGIRTLGHSRRSRYFIWQAQQQLSVLRYFFVIYQLSLLLFLSFSVTFKIALLTKLDGSNLWIMEEISSSTSGKLKQTKGYDINQISWKTMKVIWKLLKTEVRNW